MKMTDIKPIARVTGEGEHGPPVGNAGRMWSWPDLGANLYGQQAIDALTAEVGRLSGANIAYAEQVAKLIGRAGNAEAARLAADQQKGGGEVVAWPVIESVLDRAREQLGAAGGVGSAGAANSEVERAIGNPLIDWITDELRSATPQPSIPAPAQQDGKASGGEVTIWLRAEDVADLAADKPWTAGAVSTFSQRQTDEFSVAAITKDQQP